MPFVDCLDMNTESDKWISSFVADAELNRTTIILGLQQRYNTSIRSFPARNNEIKTMTNNENNVTIKVEISA